MIKERHPGSCEWLFSSSEYYQWSADQTETPIFWLHGMHGAGKSFLCSAAIEKIRENSNAPSCTAIQYLKKGMEVSKSHVLQNLAYQMTKALEAACDDVPDSIVRLIEECKDDTGLFDSLICCLLSEVEKTYIFIDGLDEAPNGSDIQSLVEFLVEEAIRMPDKMRLWFGSQPLPQIEEYVRKSHGSHLVEKSMQLEDTSADIQAYLESAIPESISNGTEFARVVVQSCMETEVHGSFLWASSMISDLKERAEDADDMIRLALRGLPTRMDDVYQGIIEEYKKQDKTRKSLHSNLPLWRSALYNQLLLRHMLTSYRIILSLLAYTKRPLRLFELREGIAMLRSATGEDLNTSKFVSLTAIRKVCSRLVRFIQAEESEGDGTLELNHSAVFAFLRGDSDSGELSSEEQYVSPSLICELCIKYLSQPRYSKLLRRETHYDFITWSGDSVLTHQLLLYTAKYWYRHCDERPTSTDFHEQLRQFILSPNFHTLIQVQSLSIIGHFLLSFDRITGEPKAMKKILPACASNISEETAQILPQLCEFLYEWSEFLQLGLTSEFNGEIDRCFWRALGPAHFLRNGQERYHSFHFMSPQTPSEANASSKPLCFLHTLSHDGRDLVLCRVQSGKYVATLADLNSQTLTINRKCDDSILSLLVEKWCIDGTRTPCLIETMTLNVSCADVQWSLYSTPCSRKVGFVPRSTSVLSPGCFALLDGKSGLRVGSRVILTKDEFGSSHVHFESTPSQATASETRDKILPDEHKTDLETPIPRTIAIPENATILTEYSEDVVHRANLLIICRRRIPKSDISEVGQEKKSRHDRKTDKKRGFSESSSSNSDTDDQESGSDDDNDDDDERYAEPAFSDSSSLKSAASSDPVSSVSDESVSLGENSSDARSDNSSSLSEDFGTLTESEESNDSLDLCPPSDDVEDEDASGSDSTSLLSMATSGSSDDVIHDALVEQEDGDELGNHYEYPVGITGQPRASSKCCDSCREALFETWYHCATCAMSNYDLCHDCVKSGKWCLDKEHQLYEEVSEVGVVSVISWSHFILGQELLVFDTTSTMDKPIFTHSLSESAALHQSAPSVHPQLPLVVWPICAEKLLFIDTSKRNASKKAPFSLHSFKATSSKGTLLFFPSFQLDCSPIVNISVARQISIELYFSPCGTLLHVGSVEAIQRKGERVPRVRSSLREKHYDLAFHVTTMRLSPTDPAKHPPTIISRQCHALGVWTKPFVSVLPYSWTWTPAATYFTMTGSKLRVYHVPLSSPQSGSAEEQTTVKSARPSHCSPALITTPSETVFLPRSARERSIQFFPPREPVPDEKMSDGETPSSSSSGGTRVSTLIIGPRYGRHPSPPIGVYLTATDLGPWINIHDKEGEERIRAPRRRFTGLFEEFDEDDDCDIIPFDDGR